MSLRAHPTGGYFFLPGIAPYSCGAVSAPGFEVVHAAFDRLVPWREGLDRAADHLARLGRPRAALCGVELRSPRPFTFEGFAAFNRDYAAVLESWGLFVEGVNPVPRTNVAPAKCVPREPALFGFSYTVPCAARQPPTGVVAGAGELPEGVLAAEAIIARGDLSEAGLASKIGFVMDLMESRLRGLRLDWRDVSAVDVYTVHPVDRLMSDLVLGRIGVAALRGVCRYDTRPPIEEIEFEMDLRCVRTDVVLAVS